MGDSLVSSLVSDVVRKLTSIAIQEIGLLRRLKNDVLTLTDDFNNIQAVLHDAEEKQTKEEVVQLWLKSLRSASLQVENVLDEVSTEALLQRLHIERGVKYRVRGFFSSNHNQLMVRTRIAHNVKDIRKKIAYIAAQKNKFNLTPDTTSVDIDSGVPSEMPNRETSSRLIHSSMIYGRNEEMEMVAKKICNKDINKYDDVKDIRVYAIWGMGGLGKTTLAQLVYNHERVDKHFELKCWIYVSEKFQIKELIRGLIESIDKSECRLSQLDGLQLSLEERLHGKRFLVVLDDVWIEEEHRSEWGKLSNALSCGAEGSIIMVTTRNQTTTKMIVKDPELQHELGCLSKVDSWSLFKKLAFPEGRKGGDRRQLEPIGKDIVEKCKGLPLAIKTLGSMMLSKSSTKEWELVRDNHIWELQENKILPALKLSYDNLLPHIKRCFSYCCLFRKGFEMKKDLLILLWMANGLIPPRGEADVYMLGEEIYKCLVWRSFFQVVDEKYKMHDLMHDLARYVTRHDCLVIDSGKELITPEEVLHLSSSSPLFLLDLDFEKLISLRSIFIFNEYVVGGIIRHIVNLVNLRVLFLDNHRSKTLPESICKLKYLKYLNLSHSKIEVLPESIIYLQNLQVLLLELCENLCRLPDDMRFMRNLQHLNIKGCCTLYYLPVGILKGLLSLRLTHFPIVKKKGAKIGELGDLNLNEGELNIRGLGNEKGGLGEAKSANLKSKTNLLVLRLHWYDYSNSAKRIALDEEVLEGLEPNPSLEELEIIGWKGNNIAPSWIVNLNNLVKIKFGVCKNCENIPPLGKLPSLRVIVLSVMDSLKCFDDEDNATTTTALFPSLQELHLRFCEHLVSLPSYFPKLKELHIQNCMSLLTLPEEIQSFKNLNVLIVERCENLSIMYENDIGVDWPKISHIPNITITPTSEYK